MLCGFVFDEMMVNMIVCSDFVEVLFLYGVVMGGVGWFYVLFVLYFKWDMGCDSEYIDIEMKFIVL